MCYFTTISQSEVAIVERLGKFSRELQAGCHFMICCIENVRARVSVRLQQLDVHCETKTKDNVFVTIKISVQYLVDPQHVQTAFYKLTNPAAQMTSFVYDDVRASVPRMELDQLFEQKDDVAKSVQQEIGAKMTTYGFNITHVLITDIDVNPEVKRAMNAINAAQRERVAANDRAEAEKIAVVKRAEADAESKYLAGVGLARQRQAIVSGLRDSVVDFQSAIDGTSSKDVLDLVLLTQYLDMLKDVGTSNGSKTIFVPHSPSGLADLQTQIRDGFMQGDAAK